MFNNNRREEHEIAILTGHGDERNLKAEPTSTLEALFNMPLFISVMCLGSGLLWLLMLGLGTPIHAPIGPGHLISLGLLLLPIGYLFHRQIDVHYLVHFDRHEILSYRRVFSSVGQSVLCKFEDIHCVTPETDAIPQTRKRAPLEYRYGLFVILKTGRKLRLFDSQFKSPELIDEYGKKLAHRLGVDFVPGSGVLKIKRTREGLVLTRSRPSRASCFEAVFAGCALFLILAFAWQIGLGWWRHRVPAREAPAGVSLQHPSLWSVRETVLVLDTSDTLNSDLKRNLLKSIPRYGNPKIRRAELSAWEKVELLTKSAYDFPLKENGKTRDINLQVAKVKTLEGQMGWTVVSYSDPNHYEITNWVNERPKRFEK